MFRRGLVFWTWVSAPSGERRRVSTESSHEKTALSVDAWQRDVAGRLDRLGVVQAIVDGRIGLGEAYSLGEQGAAGALDARSRAASDAPVTVAQLDAWEASVNARGKDVVAPIYRRQVGVLFPNGIHRSDLTPADIMDALDALPVSDVTKGRYRAALSSLCAYLVRSRWLDSNPMASVAGFMQSPARSSYYTPAEAERLLAALPQPFRALETLMYACGWEWGACEAATVGDIDIAGLTAFARGTKNAHRLRLTVFTEPHLTGNLDDVLASKLPGAKLLPEISRSTAIKVHQRTAAALGLAPTTLHDWRHTYAVKELKKGVAPQAVGQMLGHSTAALVISRYGRWTNTPEEVRERAKALRTALSQSVSHSSSTPRSAGQ